MTEAEWLATTDPDEKFYQVVSLLKPSKYRRDLFSVACYRILSHLIEDEGAKWAFEWLDEHPGQRSRSGSSRHVNELFHGPAQALYDAHHRRELGVGGAAVHVAYDIWAEWYEYAFPNLHDYRSTYPETFPKDPDAYLLAIISDIFGNPFRPITLDPSWRTEVVTTLARGIYADRAFDRLPILADALQEAGCDNADVLTHCRGDGPHARGCWVVDQLLGKA